MGKKVKVGKVKKKSLAMLVDPRFVMDKTFEKEKEEDDDDDNDNDSEGNGPTSSQQEDDNNETDERRSNSELENENEDELDENQKSPTATQLIDLGCHSFAGPSSFFFSNNNNNNNQSKTEQNEENKGEKGKTVVKPLTPEALAAYNAKQERTGVIYISRIPPGMRPLKVRHLMSQYGEVGRVYLQQEDPKRAYLRRKFTSTKKVHYTEGWVEFMDKHVARSVAEMLNTQPIGGKKGTRFCDDVWTMKYLPKFKWYMLTEQIAHETAIHTARLRVELEQSRREQREYLKHVELARVLDKRAKRKRKVAEEKGLQINEKDLLPALKKPRNSIDSEHKVRDKTNKKKSGGNEHQAETDSAQLKTVLGSIF